MQLDLELAKSLFRQALNRFNFGDAAAKVFEKAANGVHSVAFTVGAEDGSNNITVNVQANDVQGNPVEEKVALTLMLVDAADPTAFNTSDYTISAGTDGDIVQAVADGVIIGLTEADGDLDIVLQIAGAATSYMIAIGPSGRIIGTSGVITHAA